MTLLISVSFRILPPLVFVVFFVYLFFPFKVDNRWRCTAFDPWSNKWMPLSTLLEHTRTRVRIRVHVTDRRLITGEPCRSVSFATRYYNAWPLSNASCWGISDRDAMCKLEGVDDANIDGIFVARSPLCPLWHLFHGRVVSPFELCMKWYEHIWSSGKRVGDQNHRENQEESVLRGVWI